MGEEYDEAPRQGVVQEYTFVDDGTIHAKIEDRDGNVCIEEYTFESGEVIDPYE